VQPIFVGGLATFVSIADPASAALREIVLGHPATITIGYAGQPLYSLMRGEARHRPWRFGLG